MKSPTPSTSGASTRERLLDAAARLFHEQGVNIGVDALCRAAPGYAAALLPAPDDGRSPRARILHVFERLEYLEPAQDFLGCPFVATAIQVKSPEHPATLIARRQKDALTSFFQHEARRGGARDPELLARQLTLVFDGASARSVVQARELDGLAVTTAGALLDIAGMTAGE